MDVGQIFYTAMEVLIAVFCSLSNMLVILALWKTKSIQKPTYCVIVSLAVADFLVGSVAIPFAVVVDGQIKTSFHMCLFISCTIILFTLVSVLCLAAIAVDRFLRVYVPIWYKRTVTWRHSYFGAAACWLVAVPLSYIPMFGWHENHLQYNMKENVCHFLNVISMDYIVFFNFFLCTLTPLLLMTALYIYVFCYVQRNLRVKPGDSTQYQSYNYLRKEKQLAASLSLILVLFALCWLPLHVMNCIEYFRSGTIIDPAFQVGILLSHANSAVNPVVYAFKMKNIRRAYEKLWQHCTSCQSENQTSQTNKSTTDSPSMNMISESKEDCT